MVRVGQFEIKRIKDIPLVAGDEIMLTAEGREAAEQEKFSDNRGRILEDLSVSGATKIEELSDDTRIPIHKIKQAVSDLIKKGLARKAGVGSPDPIRDIRLPGREMLR